MSGERHASEGRPFAAVVLVVLATQAFYVFHDTVRADPDVWPVWGFLAGGAAWLFLRPADARSAGFTKRKLGAGLRAALAMVLLSLLCLGLGWLFGAFEIVPGVNRLAADQLGDLLLRMLCFYAVALLGDELAFRSILQSEATRRYGAVLGILLIAVFFAVYRVPLAVRVGLVDVQPDRFELGRMGLVLLRGLLDGLALGLLFRLCRNLWATALYGWFLAVLPVLFLGNAEEALEPMRFMVGHGNFFDAVVWMSVIVPVVVLAAANLMLGESEELPTVSTPDWLVRNSSFTAGGTPTDP